VGAFVSNGKNWEGDPFPEIDRKKLVMPVRPGNNSLRNKNFNSNPTLLFQNLTFISISVIITLEIQKETPASKLAYI